MFFNNNTSIPAKDEKLSTESIGSDKVEVVSIDDNKVYKITCERDGKQVEVDIKDVISQFEAQIKDLQSENKELKGKNDNLEKLHTRNLNNQKLDDSWFERQRQQREHERKELDFKHNVVVSDRKFHESVRETFLAQLKSEGGFEAYKTLTKDKFVFLSHLMDLPVVHQDNGKPLDSSFEKLFAMTSSLDGSGDTAPFQNMCAGVGPASLFQTPIMKKIEDIHKIHKNQ